MSLGNYQRIFLTCYMCALFVMPRAVAAMEPTARDIEQAKELNRRGMELADSHQYREAAETFRAAYGLVPRPMLLFFIAEAYFNDGHPDQALTYYESFVAELTVALRLSEKESDALTTARAMIIKLNAKRLETNPPTEETIPPPEEGTRPYTLTPPPDLRLRPPMQTTPANEEAPEKVAAPRPSRTHHNLVIAGSILLVSGAGAVAGGGWIASQLDGTAQRLEQDVAAAGQWSPDYDRRLADGHNMQSGSAVLIGFGIPMTIVGAILLAVGAAR